MKKILLISMLLCFEQAAYGSALEVTSEIKRYRVFDSSELPGFADMIMLQLDLSISSCKTNADGGAFILIRGNDLGGALMANIAFEAMKSRKSVTISTDPTKTISPLDNGDHFCVARWIQTD